MASVASAVLAVEKTPPGSYLVYRATTVTQLRNEVAKVAVVRTRYSGHFGVSPEKLDGFFAANLTLTSLKQPLRAQCWYIDRAGRECVKTKLLPRGTMVFATKSGEPLLAWSCGNPLRTELPTTLTKASSSTLVASKPKTPLEVKVLANPIETISTAVVTAPPAPAVVSVLPVEAPPVLASIAAPAVAMPPIFASASQFGAGWLGAIGGLGGIAGSIRGRNDTFHPTPEVSGFAMLGSLMAFMPVAYRVRKRRVVRTR